METTNIWFFKWKLKGYTDTYDENEKKDSKCGHSEAGDRWAPRANGSSSFLVDRYSEMGLTGQLREEAGPCPDRR